MKNEREGEIKNEKHAEVERAQAYLSFSRRPLKKGLSYCDINVNYDIIRRKTFFRKSFKE